MDNENTKRWQWIAGNDENTIGLIDYLNHALNAVAMQRPDCYAITEVIHLEAGMLQKIPQISLHGASKNAVLLCELTRNMNKKVVSGGDVYEGGMPIIRANRQTVFAWFNPNNKMTRYSSTNVDYNYVIDNYMYDRATNPKIYYVYPPVPVGKAKHVECTYYALPPTITSVDNDIGVAEGYAQAIAHHMMASIFEADNEHSGGDKAAYHMQMFEKCMSIKLQVDSSLPRAEVSLNTK
ncbi:MAG: hypothetical protein IJU76_08355 [Desulfovibrionaceae bacterium]|nr:hypothetical protein [Desulfovibrionaceae bacterium]